MANEYYLKPPSQQLFYKIMAFCLSIMSLNKEYWAFYKMPNHIYCHVQRKIVLILIPVSVVSQVVYLVMNYSEHDFTTLAVIYTVLPVTLLLLIKIAAAQSPAYKKAMIEFLEQIHVFSYYEKNKQPHVKEILIKAEKLTRWSIYIFSGLCMVCTCAFLIVPILHNVQNFNSIHNITSRLEIMVHFWMPFDYEFNYLFWGIMQVVTMYCVILAVSIVVVFDVTNLIFLYHLNGHVQILNFVLKEDFNEKMTEANIRDKLIEVTKYYAYIRRIFKDVEAAFGLNIIGIYMHNLVGGGLLIYQIMASATSTETLLSYGLMIPIYMGELIIMSLVMENIRIQADAIPELIYNLRWEKMSIPNQKLLMMVLFQVQPVLEIKAAFSAKTGIQPAINIIKTTFSYYVMIKSRM